MSLFDRILTQPIFNLLAFIYNFIGDFGVAIIILTVIVRLCLWPLVKKQLYQTRVMREIQPELKKIREKAKGNRLLESTMMMELYREKNVKPFSSLLVLIIQLPIMLAIFRVVQISSGAYSATAGVTSADYIYPFLEHMGRIPTLLAGQQLELFGVIDLARTVGSYWPALIIALAAAFFQYCQSKQVLPDTGEHKKLRDMFKEAANGKEVDQSEMMAATNRNMIIFMPIMTFLISLAFPGAVVLYYATSSLLAIIQQRYVLSRSEEEMEKLASKRLFRRRKNKESGKTKREQNAKEAVIVRKKKDVVPADKTATSGGKTVVRRIKAK